MPVSLDDILGSTKRMLPALRARRRDLERAAERASSRPSLLAALRAAHVALIAEVKRRSPSAGAIREDLDPVERADAYAAHGASAISVLTDGPFFGGSIEDLAAVADKARVPVLRKDFILSEEQIFEARAAGASAVLLIVRALERPRLRELLRLARGLELDVLVEVHDERELDGALEADATIVGVNSRDLDTFRIDTDAAWTLLARVPPDRIAVAESGMSAVADVERAALAGADAVLIGTALSGADDPGALVRELVAVPRYGR
jgi:indole-3-glycerol phosphate synthase